MRLLLRFFAFAIILLCSGIMAIAQSSSSKGTEFWTTWMDHKNKAVATNGVSPSQMVLYITSDVNTSGQVEFGTTGTTVYPFTVVANQVNIIPVPATEFLNSVTGILPGKGIHITALQPIAVYAHIYAQSVSGATLLLPLTALGKNYTSINYSQFDGTAAQPPPAYSVFDIVATDDNTSVEITPAADLTDGQHPAGTPFTVTLSKGDVYQGESTKDLTGTKIRSVSIDNNTCKRIAVFSGSSKLTIPIPGSGTSGDNLFQQVYPTSTWGKNFITVPLLARSVDIFRVIFTDPNTNVTGLPVAVTPADFAKGYVEYSSTVPQVISADKPIQVVQYAVTQSGELGDPEMIYLNPIEQGLNHITLYSSGRYRINQSYINVVIPTAGVSSFKLDGSSTLPSGATFSPVSGTNFSYAQIPVSSGPQDGQPLLPDNGTHNLTANTTFSAIAYGFGKTESYGYSGGTNLKNLSEFIALQDPVTNNYIVTNGCSNVPYNPQLTVPFRVSTINWNVDGTLVTQTTNLNERQTYNNNQVTYTYSYYDATKSSATINLTVGTHSVVATVFNPNGDCGSTDDIDPGPINIIDSPNPTFTFSTPCAGSPILFNVKTPADVTSIASLSWDFGDGSTSADLNASHTYNTPADYQVKLTINYNGGCTSISDPVTIHIAKKPLAIFSSSTPGCETQNITFKSDASNDPEGGTITGWNWDFGDLTPPSTDQNPVHNYAAAGNYLVKLTVTNDKGCQSDITTQPLVVHPIPVADFTAPDICLTDGALTFTNQSNFKGEPESSFSYKWEFNDPYSTTANNTANSKNPSHNFTKAGTYNVSLTLTSGAGCISSVTTKQVIVNNSNPTANFLTLNKDALCAGSLVLFKDATTTYGGDVIAKLVWNFGDGSPDSTVLRNDIPADGMYHHSYPFKPAAPNSPTQQQYTVTLHEYTGLTCTSTASQVIVINANPIVNLTYPAEICQETSPVTIIENAGNFKGTGTGAFVGDGTTTGGVFDPYKAGVGLHVINYTYTDNRTGCAYFQTFNITVNPTPIISLGPDFKLLEGDTTKLAASVLVDNLTYKWYPSAGLNHDDVLNPAASPTDDTKYILTATSAKGCSSSASLFVTVLKLPKIPNTFTPNGDGVNDFWVIDQLNKYPDATVEVYNRNGEKVYSSIGYTIPWDGKYKGAELPVGVYYYIINPKERRKTMSGFVTIVR